MTKKELEEVVELQSKQIKVLHDRLESSDVFSDSFWKRALAIVGHNLAFWVALWLSLGAIATLLDL